MQVIWHGLNCIRLEGKDVSIVMDPFGADAGKLPKTQTDIVTLSNEDLDPEVVGGEPFVIDVPGEYEIKGAFIYGIPWRKEKVEGKSVLYRVNFEDLSFGHLAGLDRVVPNAALETLEDVDVLFVPVGDPEQLSAKDAAEIISRIEPRVIVLMNYAAEGIKAKLTGPEAFIKELGVKPESVDKLKLIKKDLPTEDRKVYLLNPS